MHDHCDILDTLMTLQLLGVFSCEHAGVNQATRNPASATLAPPSDATLHPPKESRDAGKTSPRQRHVSHNASSEKKKEKKNSKHPTNKLSGSTHQSGYDFSRPAETGTTGRRQQKRDRTVTVKIRGSSALS
ncbi:hypothetical protein CDAR_234351 [Caerostris darwini]|uniref:Uncharacterized protein n=1 Tax=Caerostris darwini TaxID=1538125 RepID=A0AAV4QIT4_9ARAC|nr:hypothetical protein CDAR_234351 [Caerostris darwini]